MTIRVLRLSPARRLALTLASVAGWLALAWLDAHAGPTASGEPLEVQTAHIFSLIVAGIQVLAGWLATAATVTVTYLAKVLVWLSLRVGHILRSTGAMFAKSWQALKIVWSDVLKPALVWIDKWLTRIHDWLVKTFKPVFKWLQRLREEVLGFYKRFVRPIIDTIDFIRAINRVLLTFHIKVLQDLDRVLTALERRIEEPIFWILTRLNQLMNVLDTIVDLGGLFQRVTLVKSLTRYAPDWLRVAWNAQQPTLTAGEIAALKTKPDERTPKHRQDELVAYLDHEAGPLAPIISEMTAQLEIDLRAAA